MSSSFDEVKDHKSLRQNWSKTIKVSAKLDLTQCNNSTSLVSVVIRVMLNENKIHRHTSRYSAMMMMMTMIRAYIYEESM